MFLYFVICAAFSQIWCYQKLCFLGVNLGYIVPRCELMSSVAGGAVQAGGGHPGHLHLLLLLLHPPHRHGQIHLHRPPDCNSDIHQTGQKLIASQTVNVSDPHSVRLSDYETTYI